MFLLLIILYVWAGVGFCMKAPNVNCSKVIIYLLWPLYLVHELFEEFN